ncbi:hypothetical protein ACA910_020724 [Epithemia clementina (nom. ined.)]
MNDDQHLPFASSVAKQPHPLPTRYKHYDPSVLLMPSPADEISYFADTTLNQSDSSDMDDEDDEHSNSTNTDDHDNCSATISDNNLKPKAVVPHTLLPPSKQQHSSISVPLQQTPRESTTQQTTTIGTTDASTSHQDNPSEDTSNTPKNHEESPILPRTLLPPSKHRHSSIAGPSQQTTEDSTTQKTTTIDTMDASP